MPSLSRFLFGQLFEWDMSPGRFALGFKHGDFFLQLCDVLVERGFAPLESLYLARLDLSFRSYVRWVKPCCSVIECLRYP